MKGATRTIRRDPRLVKNLTSLTVGVLGIVGLCDVSQAQIQFQDKTAIAGPFHVGESFGATWVDVNADGRPDLLANNHRLRDSYYRNNGLNGSDEVTFSSALLQVDTSDTEVPFPWGGPDTHGAASADFDGDGDQDLFVTTGVNAPASFFVNEGGVYVNRTTEFNLGDDVEGRHPVWVDYDNNGLTDLVMVQSGYAHMYKQTPASPAKFTKVTGTVGMTCSANNMFGQLADLDGDGRPEIICVSENGNYPQKIYKTTTVPFTDVTSLLPLTTSITDAVLADFDNNGRIDVFFTRGKLRVNEILQISSTRIEASLNGTATGGVERGFSFTSTGRVRIIVNTNQLGTGEVFLGATGIRAGAKDVTLDATNPQHRGIQSHTPSINKGLYLGFNTSTNRWEVWLSPGPGDTRAYIQAINGDTGVTLGNMTIFPNSLKGADLPIQPRLLMHKSQTGNYADETVARGLGTPIACSSVAAADFDNDMDVDIFAVCRGGVQNITDRLWRNLGTGVFQLVAGAGGAQGPIGAGIGSNTGIGSDVITADYDVDGWVDLFMTNGLNLEPDRIGGPDKIFRNTSSIAQGVNANHWIELDLVGKVLGPGIVSNRDAIGARVRLTVGGVTQHREQNGGHHRWSQSHQRIHFGLAGHTVADRIEVRWPSGRLDIFSNVAADTPYQVAEGSSSGSGTIVPVILGPVPPFPAPHSGDECGVPLYSANNDSALFLYRDCATGLWSLRASAGGKTTNVRFEGDVTSSQALANVTPFNIETGDVVDNSLVTKIHFRFNTAYANQDGVNFTIPAGVNTCLSTSLPAGVLVLVGPDRKVAPMPFNLRTFGACN